MDRRSVQLYDLSGHPEYAACVGEIVAVWSKIELRLSVLFSFLLRAPPWTAWAAWFSLFNSKSRQDMIRSLVAGLEAELPEKASLIRMIDRVAKAPTARQGYAQQTVAPRRRQSLSIGFALHTVGGIPKASHLAQDAGART